MKSFFLDSKSSTNKEVGFNIFDYHFYENVNF